MVDLARQVCIVFLRALEHDLGAIGELVRRKIDLAEAAFPDKSPERVIADRVEFGGGELVEEGLIRAGKLSHAHVSHWHLEKGSVAFAEADSGWRTYLIALFLQFVLCLRPGARHRGCLDCELPDHLHVASVCGKSGTSPVSHSRGCGGVR